MLTFRPHFGRIPQLVLNKTSHVLRWCDETDANLRKKFLNRTHDRIIATTCTLSERTIASGGDASSAKLCRVGFSRGIPWSHEMSRDLASSPHVSFPFRVPHCVKLTSQSPISSLCAELSETPTQQHDTFKTCLTIKRDNLSGALANLSPHLFSESREGLHKKFRHNLRSFCGRYFAKTYVTKSFQTVRHPTEKMTWNAPPCDSRTVSRRSVSLIAMRLYASMPRVHVLFMTSRMPAPAGPESGTSSSCSVARFSNNGMVGRITALGGKGNIGHPPASVLPEHPLRQSISSDSVSFVSFGISGMFCEVCAYFEPFGRFGTHPAIVRIDTLHHRKKTTVLHNTLVSSRIFQSICLSNAVLQQAETAAILKKTNHHRVKRR